MSIGIIIIVTFSSSSINNFLVQTVPYLFQAQQASAQFRPDSFQNKPAFLKIIVRVNNTGGGNASPSDFRFSLLGTDTFQIYGSESGTIVTLSNGGHYTIYPSTKVVDGVAYGFSVSGGDCRYDNNSFLGASAVGTIKPGGKHICIITEIAPNF